MKRTLFICAALSFFAIILYGLTVWKTVIQPKNTRLDFYEIITASRHIQYGEEQALSSLNSLKRLNKDHLKLCEQIQYFNRKVYFEDYLDRHENDKLLPKTSLQRTVKRHSGKSLSLTEISQIGETEFQNVMLEIDSFENELESSGYAKTLSELAKRPDNFSLKIKGIEKRYNDLIALGEQSLKHRFLYYDIPKGSAKVIEATHKLSAYASYDRRNNSLRAYFDEESYNNSIAAFISIHEIFPGHHLKVKSRSSNLLCVGDNPNSFSWLDEGWATYAEFIANEEGFFDKPEHKLAWLDYRLTRAMRMVLDVKRMQGLKEYEALKLIWDERMPERLKGRFKPEYDRLKTSNHQHVSYILGYQAILNTKTRLMSELGDSFDEKLFHDAILRLDHNQPNALYDTTKVAMKISAQNTKLKASLTK